jgi:hypothetical protein
MHRKLLTLLAVCLLVACQRPSQTSSATAQENEHNPEPSLVQAVYGKQVLAQGRSVLGAKVFANGQAALVISEIPADSETQPEMRDSALKASISVYLLEKNEGQWRLAQRHESIADVGSHGVAGELTWLTLGEGRPGFAIVDESGNRGQTVKSLALFDLGAADMRALAGKPVLIHSDNNADCEDERPQCWNVSGQWRLVHKPGQAFAALEIGFSGVLEQRPESVRDTAETSAAGAGEQSAYEDDVAALAPRERQQINATARYALSEKGIRLVSGENVAERF